MSASWNVGVGATFSDYADAVPVGFNNNYTQGNQATFLYNHPAEQPSALQYMASQVPPLTPWQKLRSVELQIELQDSGSVDNRTVEFYGFAVTTDLSSSGLTIVPEPTTLLLTLLALASVPLRMRHS